jgi:predicted O-methyltransferase YrrM
MSVSHVMKQLAARPRVALRLAIRKPGTAWRYLLRNAAWTWKRHFLASRSFGAWQKELNTAGFLDELDQRLAERFQSVSGVTVRGNKYNPGSLPRRQAAVIYALTRERRPETVVETGVCNGYSTAVWLEAMRANGTGRLFSIDYPEYAGSRGVAQTFWSGKGGAVVPEDCESGWLVPPPLRDRWDLRLGTSASLLEPLLEQQGPVDMFFHDSEHSKQNQLFEFRAAWKHLKPGGLIVASDINWSDAFDEFWREVKSEGRRFFIDHSLALVEKTAAL